MKRPARPGRSRDPAPARKKTKPKPRVVFVAMPFKKQYDDAYILGIVPAAKAVGAACKRVDHEKFTGDIVQEIKRLIDESAVVVCDLSESRPNVLFELGYAQGKGRPTVLICSTPLTDLPFDVRNENAKAYSVGQVHKLPGLLKPQLRSALRRSAT